MEEQVQLHKRKGLAAFRKSQNFISPSAAPVTPRVPTFPG